MKALLSKIGAALVRFMQGRNGEDALGRFALIAAVVLTLVDMLAGSGILSLLGLALLAYSLFRSLSRNRMARARENERFLALSRRVTGAFAHLGARARNARTTKYFTCKGCGQHLSVPKGKGTLRVTCPKCGRKEEIRS